MPGTMAGTVGENNNQGGNMSQLFVDIQMEQIVSTILYSFIGVAVFMIAYLIIDKISPFSVKKEISQDHNTALGIIIGSVIIGLALIISAAIH